MSWHSKQDLWQPNQNSQERFASFDGLVRLIITSSPWQMVLTFQGSDISQNRIRASLDRRVIEGSFTPKDLTSLLIQEEDYLVQLEPGQSHLATPTIMVELVSRQISETGVRLELAYKKMSDELDEIVSHYLES